MSRILISISSALLLAGSAGIAAANHHDGEEERVCSHAEDAPCPHHAEKAAQICDHHAAGEPCDCEHAAGGDAAGDETESEL